jgi:hypothetical protein
VQRGGRLAQDRIRTAVGRRHAGYEEEPRRWWKFAGLLVALKLDGCVGRTAAHRLSDPDAIERLTLQMV